MSERMTRRRARALWEAASRGIDEWDGELCDTDDGTAGELQAKINAALAAMRVLQSRYIGSMEF